MRSKILATARVVWWFAPTAAAQTACEEHGSIFREGRCVGRDALSGGSRRRDKRAGRAPAQGGSVEQEPFRGGAARWRQCRGADYIDAPAHGGGVRIQPVPFRGGGAPGSGINARDRTDAGKETG